MNSSTRTRSRRFARHRPAIVWASFLAAITVVSGVLAIDGGKVRGGFVAASLSSISDQPVIDPILSTERPLDRRRWTSIVIHHSGAPTGDPQSIARQHQSWGYAGLGYHFLIGNGNGLGDGDIHIGYRWIQQSPGAHVAGPQGQELNQHAIGICVIGNGDRREFTDAQMNELVSLVRRLQRVLHIPASAVHLHRDLAPGVTSPGRLFPAARLREQLSP